MPKRELEDIDCQKLVEELATRMQLEDEEREMFTHRCMTRAGYTASQIWSPPGNKNESGGPGKRETHGKGWFPNA